MNFYMFTLCFGNIRLQRVLNNHYAIWHTEKRIYDPVYNYLPHSTENNVHTKCANNRVIL